jgi:hypothetical protein
MKIVHDPEIGFEEKNRPEICPKLVSRPPSLAKGSSRPMSENGDLMPTIPPRCKLPGNVEQETCGIFKLVGKNNVPGI